MSDLADSKLGRVGFAVVVLCIVAVTGVVLVDSLFGQRHRAGGRNAEAETVTLVEKDWDVLSATGHRSGPASAAVTMVEFSDFECPACRHMNTDVIPVLRARYPDQIAIVYRHWPLPQHRFAYPAARAAECAADQGRFDEYADRLFHVQDSLGLKPFDQIAAEVGVSDVEAFRKCNARSGGVKSVDVDADVASKRHYRGTPTLIVNGTRFSPTPDGAALDSIVRSILARKSKSP